MEDDQNMLQLSTKRIALDHYIQGEMTSADEEHFVSAHRDNHPSVVMSFMEVFVITVLFQKNAKKYYFRNTLVSTLFHTAHLFKV